MDLESSTSLKKTTPLYHHKHEQNAPYLVDNTKTSREGEMFKTNTNIKDGCIFDKTSQLYRDSRYVSLNVRTTNVMKTNLYQVEKEN